MQGNTMRAVITVCRHRSAPSFRLVGLQAVSLLEALPGVSEIRIEREDACRAVLSYRWRDTGVRNAVIRETLAAQGIQLVG
jgi:hypothetical protein